ncbi:DegT/DnrJ/EryC1/StrS family aminotransferase, partial [Agathobacter sp.]|uniref:DegT/DnrJ/EryC1/StrS family aminotransferase n=1 Tax=Agathobacter sp. TaxID=2021311 RepID=UPI002A9097BB
NEKLADLPLRTQCCITDAKPSWHIYIIRVDFSQVKLTKKEIFSKMKEKGVVLNLHYIPVHLQPYYRQLGFKAGDFPISEQYYHEAITLPLYYDLTDEEQDEVIEALHAVLIE